MSENKKGKNFSCNNMGQRKKSDFYETPYSITKKIIESEQFDFSKKVLEPAKGNGAIERVLNNFWEKEKIASYDIEVDFLKETRKFDYIITNPPFSLAREFILTAKKVATKKFCFLLPLSYLHGKNRFDEIYCDKKYGLKKVHIFTRYPMLGDPLRDDGKYRTGMMVYAWYVFENGFELNPEIGWIDNDEDVLRTKNNRYNKQ